MDGRRVGLLYALAACFLWGVLPLYWKLLSAVSAAEIVTHRALWSLVFTAVLVHAQNGWPRLLGVLRAPALLLRLVTSAALIGSNWLVFIWAVLQGQVVQCSLGYFISPLVNVLLGVAVLRERLTTRQWLAVLLAALGVAYKAFVYGQIPWIALFLAVTFSFYGLMRKTTRVESLDGLLIETLCMTPPAVFYFMQGHAFRFSPGINLLLLGTGIVTALPLLCYAKAARMLDLSTLGLMQYISPSIQFFLALAVFQEPFQAADLVGFLCIWVALFLYRR